MEAKNIILVETLWWILTALVAAVILYPVYREIPSYPFWWINNIAIFVFITCTRYIFLLKFTPIAKWQVIKAIIVLLIVPLVFNLVNNVNFFQTYLDEQGILSFLGHLSPDRIDEMDKYIRTQMVLFGVGSVIASVLLAIRLVISIWRVRNKGTV